MEGAGDEINATPAIPKVVDKSESLEFTVSAADHSGKVSWDELPLSQELRKALRNKGFNKPSEIQEKTLPHILSSTRPNVIAQAQNGSGKTAAFTLSMLATADPASSHPQCICLCPSHELARQNFEVAKELGQFTGFKYSLLIPGEDWDSSVGAQLIFATPGKLKTTLKKDLNASHIKMFVLDEADVMVDSSGSNNMGRDVLGIKRDILKSIKQRDSAAGIQVLCFSATFSKKVKKFVGDMAGDDAVSVGLDKPDSNIVTACISQHYIRAENEAAKYKMCVELYACMTVGQSVIFVQKRETATLLQKHMEEQGLTCSVLVGGKGPGGDPAKDGQVRMKVMDEFRRGVTKVLITTDVLSRGIDVPAVTLVINFDTVWGISVKGDSKANAEETYLHRIGRTGRFGQPGLAINLISTDEEMEIIRHLAAYYSVSIQHLKLDPEAIEAVLTAMKERRK